jgi:ESS family glutamate:Na+ symporter
MFPLSVKITGGTLQGLIFEIALLGVLLFVATLLRLKIPFLKKCFIPASLIAGIIGLILGPHVLKLLPPETVATWGAMSTRLIEIIFATMLLGVDTPNLGKAFNRAGPQVIFAYSSSFFQIGLTCLITALFLVPHFGVSELFGSIIEIGYAGGHGTAGGMKELFASLNWAEGTDLGLTTATFGLFMGIFGGLAIINYSVRKGYTSVLTENDSAAETKEIFTGADKKPNAYATVSKDVIEPFALHVTLIGIALIIGQVMTFCIKKYLHFAMPLFPMAMIGGFILQKLLSKTFLHDMIDRGTLLRIQGLCLELLVAAAVASIKIPVVMKYFAPLMITVVFISVFIVIFFFYTGKRLFKDEWFEHAIVRYGATTGVAAVGLMLLRTADPEMKTKAGETYAIGSPFISPFVGGGLFSTSAPLLIAKYGALKVGAIFTVAAVAVLFVAKLCGWWNKPASK